MTYIEHFVQNMRAAWRRVRQAPTFSLIVIVTISVGIGANATVLSIMDRAFFRKLPVPEPDRIVRVSCTDSRAGRRGAESACSFPEWRELQEYVRGLDGLAAYVMATTRLGGDLAGVAPYTAFVSGNYFSVLGIQPTRGRFVMTEDAARASPVAVISDVLWRTAFARDEHIIGRAVSIGGTPFTIVGVAPPAFSGLHVEGRTDLWLPYTTEAQANGRDDYASRDARVIWEPLVGRLSAGSSLGEVEGSLAMATRALRERYPAANARTIYRAVLRSRLLSMSEAANALPTFLLAWVVIALVHLVACSNVASLMLARTTARRRELGMRLCLGASRRRIVAESLAEPALLALGGALGGLAIAYWLTKAVTRLWFLSAFAAGLGLRAATIVMIVAAGTALLFGLAPALATAKRDPAEVLRAGGSLGASARVWRAPDSVIVVTQIAVSMVLLAQALLLVGKYRREGNVPPGYNPTGLVMATVQLAARHPSGADWEALYDAAVTRATAVAGVSHVAVAQNGPLSVGGWYGSVSVPGHENAPEKQRSTSLAAVGPGYFATIGASMVAGREFSSADRYAVGKQHPSGFSAAIVNEAFAKRYWPGSDPMGRTVEFGSRVTTIVGVVRDMRDVTLSAIVPRVYFPLLEWHEPKFTLVVATRADPQRVAARLQAVLVGLPGTLPPVVRTMDDVREAQLRLPRELGVALATCAGLALLLTALGLYGMVALRSGARRREIGIRLALGATSAHVHAVLMSDAGKVAGLAGAASALVSIALVQVERAWYGPSLRFDGPMLGMALGVLALATGIAAWVPAHRATRVPPAEAMKSE